MSGWRIVIRVAETDNPKSEGPANRHRPNLHHRHDPCVPPPFNNRADADAPALTRPLIWANIDHPRSDRPARDTPMPRPRFRASIGGLLAIVALVGMTLAALVSPSPLWGNTYYSLMAMTLVLAILRAVYSRAARRAFAVGFATLGWSFFLAHYGPEPLSGVGKNLFVVPLADFLYPYTLPARPNPGVVASSRPRITFDGKASEVVLVGAFADNGQPVAPPTAWEIWTRPDRMIQFNEGSPRSFRRIVNGLLCLAFATLGGVLTRHFYRTRDDPEAEPIAA